MKICFIFPCWTRVFKTMGDVAKKTSMFPPLNLAYLAAIARRDGHEAYIVDAEAENLSQGEVCRRVLSLNPDLIALTATTPTFHIVKAYAEHIKSFTEAPIVVGGPHVTYFREQIFTECFDYFVIGQCEQSFNSFLAALQSGSPMESVGGILYRQSGKAVFTYPNKQVADLDTIPFPARDLLRNDLYTLRIKKGKKRFTTIMTSRGCPFQCIFCSTSIYGSSVRRRSVGNVLAEMADVVRRFQIDHFYFLDDTLTLDRQYMLRLCDALDEAGLSVTWEGSTRADLVDGELMGRMAKSGLVRISLGLESADARVRQIIKKDCPLECYPIANRLANSFGVETINSVMIGLPGDTRESIGETIRFVRKERALKHATLGIAIPYPGSEMYEMALRGEMGLKLLSLDFSQYQRYDSAVMAVNGMTPEELLDLQKKGLLSIYCAPWRIIPAIRRIGLITLIPPFVRALLARLKPAAPSL